ncbi:hypothetical protein LJR168_000095 [Pseudoxanthomonas sp. LjRoot168]|uniref:hypothetical protein n=1 Tax=unclassified Pseudoxanthomonas TaxID=2645906 RepID=UPI003ECF7C5D
MRKAGKRGAWLVATASLFALGSVNAQQQSPPATPVQLTTDAPPLAAVNQAWHDAWRANLEAHLRTVAARGTPRDLLVAGWLWPAEADVAPRSAGIVREAAGTRVDPGGLHRYPR